MARERCEKVMAYHIWESYGRKSPFFGYSLFTNQSQITHVLFYVGKTAIYTMYLVHRYISVYEKSVNWGCNEYQ